MSTMSLNGIQKAEKFVIIVMVEKIDLFPMINVRDKCR